VWGNPFPPKEALIYSSRHTDESRYPAIKYSRSEQNHDGLLRRSLV
jgi:hypothetical protein